MDVKLLPASLLDDNDVNLRVEVTELYGRLLITVTTRCYPLPRQPP